MKRATPATIEEVYREHGHAVLRRARQILDNEQDARDVLQDVFTSLVEHPEQFRGRSAITTWLYSVTTHACLNQLRNAKSRARLVEGNVARLRPKSTEPTTEQRAMARELLASMPDDIAQVAIYYYFDGMTHREIADVMGCSHRHVGNLLARMQQRARTQEQIA